MKILKAIFCGCLLFFMQGGLAAQTKEAISPTLESPYNTVYTHLYYLQPGSYQPEIAAKTIYLPEDSTMAEELAIELKQIYDGKGLFIRLNRIPQNPDFTDTLVSKTIYTPFPSQLPEVYLEKTDGKWFYSSETAAAIPALHKSVFPFGTDLLVNLFPEMTKTRFLGLQVWQWMAILIVITGGFIFQFVLSRILRPLIRLLARSKYSQPIEDKTRLWKVSKVLSYLVIFWLFSIALPLLQLPARSMVWLLNGLQIVSAFFIVWLLLGILDVIMQYAYRYVITTDRKLDEQLLPILKKALQVLLVISGIIYILGLLNVNVTAMIAGISIGGLALALAAQDTVKNLIGSAMIFFDRPFQIGDYIVFGAIEGTVMEVGFRSTRIRMVDQSVISVPNDQIATASVTNQGGRQLRLIRTTLSVTYDTPPVLLEKFIKGLRRIIEEHPRTQKDNFLVYFHTFGSSSLDIYFRAHIEALTLQEELLVRENISFAILRLAEKLGVRFAFPTTTMFVEEFPGKMPTTPSYEKDAGKLDERIDEFMNEVRPPSGEGPADMPG